MTARILDCTQAEYFADPCAVPSLSSSVAHTLVTESPLHAWNGHPRLGGVRSDSTESTDAGAIVHKLLLGKGSDIAIISADDFRTKLARQARDEAIAAGHVPILEHRYAEIAATAEMLRQKLLVRGVEFNGQSEVAVEWFDDGVNGPVCCRSMFDHVFMDRGLIYDLKTIRSANPKVCARHSVDYGYDIQHAAYKRALARLRPEFEGRVDMLFVFVEIQPPCDIVIARPDGQLSELGAMRWGRAVEVWERCLSRDHWPGYAETPVRLEAPPWVIAQEMEAQHANW